MKNSIRKIKQIILQNKNELKQAYKVKKIGVFGSYAGGYPRKSSDIDILVDFYEVPDMFQFLKLEYFLQKLLGKKIDLVTPRALKPLIKNEILRATVFI